MGALCHRVLTIQAPCWRVGVLCQSLMVRSENVTGGRTVPLSVILRIDSLYRLFYLFRGFLFTTIRCGIFLWSQVKSFHKYAYLI